MFSCCLGVIYVRIFIVIGDMYNKVLGIVFIFVMWCKYLLLNSIKCFICICFVWVILNIINFVFNEFFLVIFIKIKLYVGVSVVFYNIDFVFVVVNV